MMDFSDEQIDTELIAKCKAILCIDELRKLGMIKTIDTPKGDTLLTKIELATGLVFRSIRLRIRQPSTQEIVAVSAFVTPIRKPNLDPREIQGFVRVILPRVESLFSSEQKVH